MFRHKNDKKSFAIKLREIVSNMSLINETLFDSQWNIHEKRIKKVTTIDVGTKKSW